MLTGMTESDWEIVLEVFEAAQSRRGEPGMTTVSSWRRCISSRSTTLPGGRCRPSIGNWNSVWKRFWRLSRSGVFEAFFQLRRGARPRIWCRCSTAPSCARMSRPPVQKGAGKSGARALAGRVLLEDPPQDRLRGPAIAFHLTGGEVSDGRNSKLPRHRARIAPRAALTDKGYAQRPTARPARAASFPSFRIARTPRKTAFLSQTLYKTRARIEQAVGKLKRFKRVALRCEKTAESYGAFVSFACGLFLVKSVHTA